MCWKISGEKHAYAHAQYGTSFRNVYKSGVVRGLGASVTFASSNASLRSIQASVDTADNFIRSRSGLVMGTGTKSQLVNMENSVLNGSGEYVSVAMLCNAITETALEKLSDLKDSDIDFMKKAMLNSHGLIVPRSDRRLFLSEEEFDVEIRNLISPIKGVDTVHESILSFISGEVNDRISLFAEALPNEFGRIGQNGMTPLKALLIAYSVISDDLLYGSLDDLNDIMGRIPATPASFFGSLGIAVRCPKIWWSTSYHHHRGQSHASSN